MKKKLFLLLFVVSFFFACNEHALFQESDGSAGKGIFDPWDSYVLMDVHGAGAQRSDPKIGDPDDYPNGFGPQGDVIRIYNYIRPVRSTSSTSVSYPVVDTNQTTFFNNKRSISERNEGDRFYGQDASYTGLVPDYTDNGLTIIDNNTGLMWQKDAGSKMTSSEAENNLVSFELDGYSDWRLPTVKELYSLILFSGRDISVAMNETGYAEIPFIDTDYFEFEYGDTSAGERAIDAQYLSSTKYVSTTMNGDETVFGVNFADGRIKGYPVQMFGEENEYFVLYVRGNTSYGENNFIDNNDGTISDLATGLVWLKDDSGSGMTWKNALDWAEDLDAAGYSDWRLPDAKELQSIVDYTRSLDTDGTASIDPIFNCTQITDEGGDVNYPFYWTSTTHADCEEGGTSAAYLAFGEALGFMSTNPGAP